MRFIAKGKESANGDLFITKETHFAMDKTLIGPQAKSIAKNYFTKSGATETGGPPNVGIKHSSRAP